MNLKEMRTTSKIRWAGTILSLALLVYLIWHNWGELVLAVQKIAISSLLLSLVFMIISRLAVGSRWHMLLRVTDFDITWGKTLRITYAGLFASNFLPTTIGGDVVRLAGAIQFRLDGAVSAASLIVDRLVGMLGMALALPLGIPLLWDWLSTQNSLGEKTTYGIAVFATMSKWWQRGTDVLKRIWHSLALWRRQPRSLLFSLVFTGIHQVCLYLIIQLFLRDLGESLPFWLIPGIWSFIYFVTLLPVSINGYGVQELALTFFFSQVGGVSESAALAVAVLIRVIQMLASLPGAAFLPSIMAGERNTERGDTEVGINKDGILLRILVLIHEFPPVGGGGGRVAQDLCTGFAKRGHEVKVLTADLGGLADSHQEFGFSVVRLPSGRREAFLADLRAMGGYVFAGFWAARKIVKQWQPDLIHVHFAVPAGPIAWLLNQFYRVPYILTAHLGDVPGGAPEKTERWFRWINPFVPPIWHNAARVVAVSEFTRQLALKQYSTEISVIPNGVDIQKFRPKVLVQNTVPRIVFAGRFMDQKNPMQLVRVLARLKGLPWECVMFGDGPLLEDVKNEIAQYQLDERIQLRGWVEPQNVIAAFAKSEILFMPSRSEGLPVVGVQAMASGMAIVAGNAGGFIDLVKPGENGYLYDPDDVNGMCDGLGKLLSDPKALFDAREKSLAFAERYDLDTIISSYDSLFMEVINEAR